MKLEEVISKLSEYFEPDDHKERTLKGKGKWFYLPHQVVRDRLNQICPGEWSDKFTLSHIEADGSPIYLCELTICGVTRTGIGDKSNEPSPYGTPAQRAFRKAFTDACEQFGLGAYLDEQTSDRTRNAFVNYMQRRGNGKAAVMAKENDRISRGEPPTPPRKDPPPKPFGKEAAPMRPAIETKDNQQRFREIAARTGHTPQQIKAIAEGISLPTSPNRLNQAQADRLRDELLIDWAMSQNKFDNPFHTRASFQKVVAQFETPDVDDFILWQLWQTKVNEKPSRQPVG